MRRMAAPRRKQEFAPGQTVPVTGIYRVRHTAHEREHEVIAIQGELFPACRKCREDVIFTLLRGSAHMTHDMDLAGPRWKQDGEDEDDDVAC